MRSAPLSLPRRCGASVGIDVGPGARGALGGRNGGGLCITENRA